MANSSVAITPGSGATVDTYQVAGGDHRQYVISTNRGGYSGRFGSFIIPGRAATTHNLAAIHNATGSATLVDVTFVGIDQYQTALTANTAAPQNIRVSRFTALPTNGTNSTANKAPEDSSLTSSASVTLWQDASADRTSSTTALTITPGLTMTQEFGPRLITAAGYEMADRMEFLTNSPVTLRPLEGLVVNLASAAADVITTMYVVTIRWEEYT